jgi:SAM-dependent methyltransferase
MNDYNDRIKGVFNQLLQTHGPTSHHSVAWNSKESQQIRLKVLSQIANLENQIVLDVGSGLGDLYGFLKPKNVFYTGIELSEDFKQASEKKYPGLKVINADFLEHDFKTQYDFVLCSGAFNTEHPNHQQYVFAAIKKMFDLSRKGVAFNLPSSLSKLSKQDGTVNQELDVKIAYMDPAEVFNFCKSFCQWVSLRHDYLPHDFTIYLYKLP